MNILLVEDHLAIIKGLVYALKKENYEVTYKTKVEDAEKYLKSGSSVDLIILDVTLPDGNGFDLFQSQIRSLKIPTIFLTAKDEEDDIVRGLNLGAEDYVTKPFSSKELLARVNRVLLRSKKQSVIQVKDIAFDMDRLELCKDGKQVELTALELKIVHLLFVNINKVVTRNILLDKIWEWTGNDVDDHTITVYLKRIREKIGTNIIITVKGMGYRIDEK